MIIAVIAGEPSGERLAAEFVTAFRNLEPEARFLGVGGELLRSNGVEIMFPMSDLTVVGLTEVLLRYRSLRSRLRLLVNHFRSERIDLLITFDFPGFNLRLASALAGTGIPRLHIVSPQVWAWRPWRVRTIRRRIDELIVLFPFEVEFYRERGMEVSYFGHPVIDRYRHGEADRSRRATEWKGDDPRPVIAYLPGSRQSELRRHLPKIAETIRLLGNRDFRHVVSTVPHLPRDFYSSSLKGTDPEFCDDAALLLEAASVGLVKTGTATLEAVAAGLPFAAFYRTSALTAALARRLARIEFLAMPNIIAGREVVREFIQEEMRPEAMAKEVRRLLDPEEQSRIRREFVKITEGLASDDYESVNSMARFARKRFLFGTDLVSGDSAE